MKVGILGNIEKPQIAEVAGGLIATLDDCRTDYHVHSELAKVLNRSKSRKKLPRGVALSETNLVKSCDILIALGGDGTMLNVARLVGAAEVPILGVNLGKLGFLAEVSVDELDDCVRDIVRGNYVIEERLVLKATSSNDKKTFYALNEIVIDRGASARVVELETFVNNEYLVTYSADGIIVTTPTGSTAYSLASGGPIVTPSSEVITIAPICPHMLTARPVIVPEDSHVRIVVGEGKHPVHITADGQVEQIYDPPVEFAVMQAPYVVKLVRRRRYSYFGLLRAKLLWGKDPRLEQVSDL
ncbi:MAG TPA: NAD(+)/NADH kinase [Bacteroidota bacterium]|nr:NAD(+)/NADH kinase [Bacteroidota bacterium]